MSLLSFRQVDVFSARPLMGNPLAVVLGADGMSNATMMALARWTQLSETVFLQRPSHPDADYRVRIFSPRGEMAFAGHPTLGACHAWLSTGGAPKGADVIQECGIGLVRVRRENGLLSFLAPPLLRSAPFEPDVRGMIARGLGLDERDVADARWVDNGAQWRAVLLHDAEKLYRLSFDTALLQGMKLGVFAPTPHNAEARYEVRALVFDSGLLEDPATGSLNAGIARWLAEAGKGADDYAIAQGRALGRDARLHVRHAGGDVWIGGQVCDCIEGHIRLDAPVTL